MKVEFTVENPQWWKIGTPVTLDGRRVGEVFEVRTHPDGKTGSVVAEVSGVVFDGMPTSVGAAKRKESTE